MKIIASVCQEEVVSSLRNKKIRLSLNNAIGAIDPTM
jgi:hypothetical protein